MANETTDTTTALSAALAAPEFVTRGGGLAMHAADRHVERWAPEQHANRVGSLRSLGFVDRLVSPWLETAQRSASLRMFSQYRTQRPNEREREGNAVSWVFPRPWYQDELDWMAAARETAQTAWQTRQAAPTMLTTRGTYIAPTAASAAMREHTAMPSALYEYVAPSLSLHAPEMTAPNGRVQANDAYSPLVPLAAVQAAQLVARLAPMAMAAASPPSISGQAAQTAQQRAAAPTGSLAALRAMLGAIVERAAVHAQEIEDVPTRLSLDAPELVTPPAPRADDAIAPTATDDTAPTTARTNETRMVTAMAEQHAKIVELQRVSRVAAQREQETPAVASIAPSITPAVVEPASVSLPAVAQPRVVAAQPEVAGETTAPVAPIAAVAPERVQDREVAQVAQLTAEDRREIARVELEAKIAARVAERTAGRTLHERARTEAATHARAPEQAALERASTPTVSTPAAPTPIVVPAEVRAAMAALPPELARVIGEEVAAHPQHAMRVFEELGLTLRATELLARGAASGRDLEVTRGPRLVMPAGLGGLVSTIDRAPTMTMAPAPIAPSPIGSIDGTTTPRTAATAARTRVPAMPWAVANDTAPTGALGQTTALGATAAAAPQTLAHVAWADRWLARFAGATPQSLHMLSATGAIATPSSRMLALADAAPSSVFVSPIVDVDQVQQTRIDDLGRVSAPSATRGTTTAVASTSPAPTATPGGPILVDRSPLAPTSVERFDDNAATPDDLFVAIAAAATKRRATPATPKAAAASPTAPAHEPVHTTYVDRLAHAAPIAPGAGLAAQLSASPFASALQHVLPLTSSRSFDVRALFGNELVASYLSGLLAPATREFASQAPMPIWARALATAGGMPIGNLGAEALATSETIARAWDPTYVSPAIPSIDAAPTFASDGTPITAATTSTPVTSVQQQPASSIDAPVAPTTADAPMRATGALTTLRSALLSWEADVSTTTGALPSVAMTPSTFSIGAGPSATAMTGMTAPAFAPRIDRGERDALALPMLGDTIDHDPQATWGAPGMIGSRAHAWSVAQERSSADLSFDFVSPELVLAARVYGFGPAEAVQAARLAIAGPTQLTAMAGTVDRTFVQAMAVEVERHRAAIATAYPGSTTTIDANGAIVVTRPLASPATQATTPGAAPTASSSPSSSSPSSPSSEGADRGVETGEARPFRPTGSSFGVARRAPRGAFLWPSAAVAALGLDAPSPDGNLAMTVAALELLAAQAVAEIGTYAALGPDARGDALATEAITAEIARATGASPGARTANTNASTGATGAAPSERQVVDTVGALVPFTRRARFDALYLALGQSTVSRDWSPAARAARALALVGRGTDGSLSAHERATTVWDVLPVVYANGNQPANDESSTSTSSSSTASSRGIGARMRGGGGGAVSSTSSVASRGRGLGGEVVGGFDGPDVTVDRRPGLGTLSSRAGEALGSYVSPTQAASTMSSTSQNQSRDQGASRAPTAAPEYVRTGARPSARAGGGESEIPAWFEQAARRMFSEQTGVAESISLTELTLIQSAPPSAVAASTRSVSSPAPSVGGSPSSGGSHAGGEADVEKIASEVYRAILDMMDNARARNGEPYL